MVLAVLPDRLEMPYLKSHAAILTDFGDHGEVAVCADVIRQDDLVRPIQVDDRGRRDAAAALDHQCEVVFSVAASSALMAS